MENEIWKEIKGYNGDYLVSNLGRILSKKRKKHRIINGSVDNRGYFNVCLSNKGKIKSNRIHRIVAETFIENTESKKEVNHINGNKLDNRVVNLEWNTPLENMTHAKSTGLLDKRCGEGHFATTLTDSDVLKILEMLKTDMTQKQIGDIFGVDRRVVGCIKLGKTWKRVTGL